jgi:hypothetical protein
VVSTFVCPAVLVLVGVCVYTHASAARGMVAGAVISEEM